MTSSTELAWAAGFIDGEGTFAFYGDHTFRLSIGQKPLQHGDALLERLNKALWNMGTIYGPNKQGVKTLVFHGAKVQQAYAMLYSYLGPVKRDQGASAIKRWSKYRPKYRICASNGHDIRTWGGKKTCKTCWDIKWKNRGESCELPPSSSDNEL